MGVATRPAQARRAELRELVPFADCTDEELERVAALAETRHVAPATAVLLQGGADRELLVVLHGSLRVHDGGVLEGTLTRGDVVGEIAALGGEPRTAHVTTQTPAELLAFSGAALRDLLSIETVARRLRAIAHARLVADGVVVEARSVPVIKPVPRVRGRGAGIRSRTEVPARPVRLIALAVVAVGMVAAGSWILVERNRTTVVTIDQLLAAQLIETGAAAELAQPPTSSTGSSPTSLDATSSPPGAASVPAPASTPATAPTTAAAAAPPATPDVSAPTPPTPEPAPAAPAAAPEAAATTLSYRTPEPGIYTYETTGGERISLAGASHEYPERTHAVLSLRDGCAWRVEHHVIEEHVDTLERCTAPDLVSVLLRGSDIEFFGQRDGLVYVCDPPAPQLRPGARPGDSSRGTCASEDGSSQLHYDGRFVGMDTLDIGGEPVEAVHIEADYELRGGAEGTSSADWWLHPVTGLTLREERVVDTQADALWGDVRYQEEATFHLVSLTPRR